MSRSVLNILDNSCTDISPCLKCPRHLDGLDKNQCIPFCQRLSAYRNGLEYDHLPWPELKDLQDVQGGYPIIEDKISPKNKKHKAKSSDTLQKTKKTRGSMPKPKKTSVKRNKGDIDKSIPKPKKPNRDKVFKLYMSKYPEIMQYITETAEKSLLPTKDVFVQLLSESIIARKGNNETQTQT